MTPHWQDLHEWLIDEIRFDLSQHDEVCDMLLRHPSDKIGELLRGVVKDIDKNRNRLCKAYKLIYGRRPDIRSIRLQTKGEIKK